ncbi:cell cycle checkpoint control protein RAD9B [Triplophysa rosa]|uniref:Cell cycle checkpoint control protein RAD9A n=1 Tax=Triplophysa rosa TaxID=992332 RepID=A0A9W7TJI5_TRIRA|nr:cell cycle checkpoint control protein RAD9B [Triplophysa rosa]KAI7798365.1 putative cell cycle checkpoint control protein RAD9A [Triplophysa rosa]
MKFVIEGNGVKVFGKAVHALSRIGDEMWLDPLEKGLAVRSVNSSQSAYGCFVFTPLFFQQYILQSDVQQCWKAAKCKLNMKCVLPLFRCVAWRERGVDKCEISINIPNNRVMFRFHCRHGITKTYNLGYQECEALQAVFPSHLCPNVLTAQPKLLSDIVVHFPVSQEEVTLSVSSAKMSLKTFCDEGTRIKGMNTELSLHPDEFDYFQVGVDSAVTFCLKELRGFLNFAESHGLPVSWQFGVAGQPVAFSVEDMMLEANVVLSTLMDQNQEGSLSAPGGDGVENTTTAVADFSFGPAEAEDADIVGIADGERVASSQNSEVFSPALHVSKMIQFNRAEETQPRSSSTTPVTPASSQCFKIRSLLFGAVFSDGGGSITGDLPTLVCASDTEEDGGVDDGLG